MAGGMLSRMAGSLRRSFFRNLRILELRRRRVALANPVAPANPVALANPVAPANPVALANPVAPALRVERKPLRLLLR